MCQHWTSTLSLASGESSEDPATTDSMLAGLFLGVLNSGGITGRLLMASQT